MACGMVGEFMLLKILCMKEILALTIRWEKVTQCFQMELLTMEILSTTNPTAMDC